MVFIALPGTCWSTRSLHSSHCASQRDTPIISTGSEESPSIATTSFSFRTVIWHWAVFSDCSSRCTCFRIIQSQNGLGLKGPQRSSSPNSLLWAALPLIRSGCPGPHPICPWAQPGMGNPESLWAAVLVPHHSLSKEFFPIIQPKFPQVLLGRAALYEFFSQSIHISGIALTQVQNLALGLVEPHKIHVGPLFKPV